MEFNLNELPAESSDEGSFFPTPTPYSIPTVTSAILPRKRKEQPAILSPARSRASRSRLGGDCSGSGNAFAGENDVGTSHSGVRESPTVDDSVVETIQLFHAPPDDKVMYLSDTTLPGLPPLEQKATASRRRFIQKTASPTIQAQLTGIRPSLARGLLFQTGALQEDGENLTPWKLLYTAKVDKVFSEARIDPIISTSYLLGVYRTEHATEYSALRQSAIPSSEFLHRFSMKASFAAMLESFTNSP
ncbi:hypothetical protein KEM48_005614 [Puccinia striiformis f. sp. tritici PST-130]|nr:hypothetical protein KEM48_005614 [Puccinia striiformis f. sp. tritici PST-130]